MEGRRERDVLMSEIDIDGDVSPAKAPVEMERTLRPRSPIRFTLAVRPG